MDGARFLPDNASCTKIIVRAYTSVLDKVGIPVGGLPDLDSFSYLPSFGFRTEYREHDFDPTTIVVVTLITIDA